MYHPLVWNTGRPIRAFMERRAQGRSYRAPRVSAAGDAFGSSNKSGLRRHTIATQYKA